MKGLRDGLAGGPALPGGYRRSRGGSANERTTAFEGAVPNLTVNYIDKYVEGEFYLGYYKAIRSEGGSPNDPATACTPIGGSGGNCLGPAEGRARGHPSPAHVPVDEAGARRLVGEHLAGDRVARPWIVRRAASPPPEMFALNR